MSEGEPKPRLPHEQDESSDSQESLPRERIRQGHDDLLSGKVDTTRGAAVDELYNRTLRTPAPPVRKSKPKA